MAARKKHRRRATAAQRRAESKREKGKKHPHQGHKESAKTRAKLRKKLRGRKVSRATRAKLSKRMRGRKLSAAERARISKALRGRKHPHKGQKTATHVDRHVRRSHPSRLRHRTARFPTYHPRHVLAGGLLSQRPDRAAPRRRRNR